MFLEDELKDQRRLAYEEGREEALIYSIKAIMKSMKLSAQQAMDALEVPPEKQKRIISLL